MGGVKVPVLKTHIISKLYSSFERVVQNGVQLEKASEIFQVSEVEMADGCERSHDKET